MAVHEINTNAAKYGALSVEQGSVQVAWQVGAAGTLSLNWRERDGPPVRPPSRRGFGQILLQRVLSGQLGGHSELNWLPEGLECRFTLPPSQTAAVA
jgi:two-component sensor histidine kinase